MRKYVRRALRRALEATVKTEYIGQEECPLMMRWTLWAPGRGEEPWFKVLIHYFPPEVTDPDPHDHPRSFLTCVLRGRYIDTSWNEDHIGGTIELVEAGQVIYRRAEHTHVVETDRWGCWTLVVMGRLKRDWGFVRLEDMSWWPWKKYVERFGGVVRCDAPADQMGQDLNYRDYKGSHPST